MDKTSYAQGFTVIAQPDQAELFPMPELQQLNQLISTIQRLYNMWLAISQFNSHV